MSKKILVVEDEKNIAELERDYLEANGYTVEIEFDGKSGLDKALGSDYDLVILDVMLPGLDGFEVCRQIRKHKECPVLMVSAKKDEIDKIRGLGIGADDYITKPFNPLEVTARVKTVLRRCRRGAGRRHLHGPAPRRLDAPVHRKRRPHGPQTGGLRQLQPGNAGP